jgi:hypothetical protein
VITVAVEGWPLQPRSGQSVDNRTDFPGPIVGAINGSIATTNGYGAVVNPNVYDPTKPYSPTAPGVITAANGTLPTSKTNSLSVLLPDPAGNPVVVATNPNWAKATAYQGVRQFRFSLRVTF